MSSNGESLLLREDPDSNSQGFRGGRDPRPNDVFIAVMGVTGSGKSSFISLYSGEPVKIGHDLSACTATVDVYANNQSPDRTIYLIDTPGFDDTNRSDTEILSEIAAWLAASYRSKILLHGIIYLHRITDIRMHGSAKRNLLMFKQLCGPDALKHVLLVTTMWDKVSEQEAIQREKELIDTPEFWGWMLSKGSSCHRHYNTEDSARDIVQHIANHDVPIATDLQKQLVDEQRALDETSAGRELQNEILKEKEKWANERRHIVKNMKKAIRKHDRETEEAMREERDRCTLMIQKAEEDTKALRANMEKLLEQRDKRVALMEKQIKVLQAKHEIEIKRFNEKQKQLEQEKVELEKEREREREAQWERESRLKQPLPWQFQIPKPNFLFLCSPYSVALLGSNYTCISPYRWASNATPPHQRQGSAYIKTVSLGDHYKGQTTWIARYSNGTWQRSIGLEDQYPRLGTMIEIKGLHNLDLCALGRGQKYYAQWQDGTWYSTASAEASNAFTEYSSKNGNKLVAVAFGFGDSYFISYGSSLNGLGWSYNLMGYYSSLHEFLLDNRDVSVVAITLDQLINTDYIIIYQRKGDNRYWARWCCSDETSSKNIYQWWETSRNATSPTTSNSSISMFDQFFSLFLGSSSRY